MKRKNLYTETGEPKRIACYMYKQEPKPYEDWVTVVYTHYSKSDPEYIGKVVYTTMSGDPFHPLGIGLSGEAERGKFKPGGSRVKFSELPPKCQELVRRDYIDIWESEGEND